MQTKELLLKQKEFFGTGATLDAGFRRKALESLDRAIRESEEEIIAALAEDLGKCRTEAYMTEIGMALSEIRCAIKNVAKWSSPRRVRTPLAQFPAKSRIFPEPYGNVLIMSPWNYPFLLCISPLASAIAAGNTVILKPSAYSPATSSVTGKILGRSFPDEYIGVVEGGREVNSDLLEMKFDYIFFTGSKSVGRLVMEKAARHLTPVTLELGGKSPVIVDETADMEVSAARIVFGKFLNCGQTCVAPDYVLVHRSVMDRFLEACGREITRMYGTDPVSAPDYGKIVNRKHFDRLCGMMKEVERNCVFGGLSDAGRLKISPSVYNMGDIAGLSCGNPQIMQEEIFGPLMPVLAYDDLEEVIRYVDSRPRPLAVYVFTRKAGNRKLLTERLHFGGGCVNDTIIHLASGHLPFGGVGESGMGHYHGKFGFETFSHLKSIVDKPFRPDLPMRYRPYTAAREKIIRLFMK